MKMIKMRKRLKYIFTLCVVSIISVVPIRTGIAAGPQTAASVCHIGSEYYDTIAEAVTAASSGDTVYVIKDNTLSASIPISKQITIIGETNGLKISRNSAIEMFVLDGLSAILTLQNIILDGGAVWSDTTSSVAAVKARTNSGLTVGMQAMVSAKNGSTLNLESGATLRNANSFWNSDIGFGVVFNGWNSNINMYDGAVNENATGGTQNGGNYSAGVCVNNGGIFNMYGGVIRGCYATDSNSNCGAAVFIRSDNLGSAGTFNMYGNARVTGNCSNTFGAITIRASYFNMYDSSTVDNNSGYYAGGVIAYTFAAMTMHNDSSVSYNNAGLRAGGVYITSSTSVSGSISSLTMYDRSKLSNNTADSMGGGCYIRDGFITMYDNSEISDNNAPQGGGLCLPISTGIEVANLISGKILNNSSSGDGSAIYFGGTGLNLNAQSFQADNEIFLTGDGTNINAKVVSLIGGPDTNSYLLDTDATNDTFAGRDVVRPASISLDGMVYETGNASSYAGFFTHTSMDVVKGADYYGSMNETSHDTFLVLNTRAQTPAPVVTPTATPSEDVPQTGDSNSIILLIFALFVSVGILVGASVLLQKTRNVK
jgi:LPXTG-motif cell wall-anchored protein